MNIQYLSPPQWQMKLITPEQLERKRREGRLEVVKNDEEGIQRLKYALYISKIRPEDLLFGQYPMHLSKRGRFIVLYQKDPLMAGMFFPYNIKMDQIKEMMYRMIIIGYEKKSLDYYQLLGETYVNLKNGYPINIVRNKEKVTMWVSAENYGSIVIGYHGNLVKVTGWFNYFDNFPNLIYVDRKEFKVYGKVGTGGEIWEIGIL